MIDTGVLQTNFLNFNLFTGGAAVGSLAGLGIYIYGGKWLIAKMKASNKQLNIFMGIVFIIAALLQLYNMFSKSGITGK